TPQGTRYEAKAKNENTFEITLAAGQAKDIQEIYALHPEGDSQSKYYTLGKLDAVTYEKQTNPLVVVQVNGKINESALQKRLDDIYHPVGVSWTIKDVENFDYPGDVTKFFEKGSGLFHDYNSKMNALISAYKQENPTIDKNANYVFILQNSGSADSVGFMPPGKQFGFVFVNGRSAEKVHTTVAHELGHGRWKLQHTFDGTGLGKGDLKDNLMNYSGGVHLGKWQWEVMDTPPLFTNPFKGDEGAMIILQDGEYIGFSPDGHVITKKDGYKTIDISPDSRYIQGFVDHDNKEYTWTKGKYLYGDIEFPDWTTESKVSGTVAVWMADKNSKCFHLYKYIQVTDYIASQFNNPDIQEAINSNTGDWIADYHVEGLNKSERAECERLAQQAIASLSSQGAGEQCTEAYSDHVSDLALLDGKSYGQFSADALKRLISNNKGAGYSYGANLKTVNIPSSVQYINDGKTYNGSLIYQEKDYIIEELNKKMAYLEVSTGYQFYSTFCEFHCIQSEQLANQSAKDIFALAEMSANSILCVLINNGRDFNAKQHYTTVGLAFGDNIPTEVQTIVREKMGSLIQSKDLGFANRLISCYKALPKKKLLNSYFIEKISDGQAKIHNELYTALQKGDVSKISALTGNISMTTEIVENQEGNVYENIYYVVEGSSGKQIKTGQQEELKEEYVNRNGTSSEQDYGKNIAFLLASKYANWDIQECEKTTVQAGSILCRDLFHGAPEYAITLQKPLADRIIDAAFFIACVVTPMDYIEIPTAAAIIYYGSKGEEDLALAYLIGCGLGRVAGEIIELGVVKAQQIQQYYRLQKTIRIVAKELNTEISTTTLPSGLVEFYEKPLSNQCHEWIIQAENSSNYWIKAEGNQVVVGRVVTNSSGETEVIYLAHDFNYGAIISEGADETALRTVVNDVTKGGSLLDDVAKATEKQLDEIFERLSKEPPFDYLPNTLGHKAERWMQYKESNGEWNYERWSNTYNANMNRANIARQVEIDYINTIGWGEHQVSIKAGNQTRRLDIADEIERKGIEIKSYETGKVYATQAIKQEISADKYLINIESWQIEWVFKGCEPSQPLKELLEQSNIIIKIIP
ncbi:MAG: hypothetical protein LBO74_13600, partial [Candidatus Symbiothrix sp.]|nr:hypothetical protein [Candidatus Symbiothrix sp.]